MDWMTCTRETQRKTPEMTREVIADCCQWIEPHRARSSSSSGESFTVFYLFSHETVHNIVRRIFYLYLLFFFFVSIFVFLVYDSSITWISRMKLQQWKDGCHMFISLHVRNDNNRDILELILLKRYPLDNVRSVWTAFSFLTDQQ